MSARLGPFVVLLAACNGSKDTTTPDTDDTEPVVDTVHTGEPPELDLTGQAGSVVLGHWPVDAYFDDAWYGGGIFVEDDEGIDNLAACLIFVGACYEAYPTDDTPVSASSFYLSSSIDAGSTISAGGVTMGDEFSGGVVFYVGSPSGFGPAADLALDGDLAPFDGADLFTFPDDVVVTSPDPTVPLLVGPADTIDLAWTSPGAGDVYLESLPSVPYSYVNPELRRLDDVGTYALPVAGLGMAGPLDARVLLLSRIVNTPVDAGGNTVNVQTRADQWLYVNYADPPVDWIELVPGLNAGEACSDALLLPPVVPGTYWGDLSLTVDDHDLAYGNPATYFPTPGREMVVPVALTAGQTLSVAYLATTRDGSVYLLDATCDLGSAVVGSDYFYYYYPEEFDYTAVVDETVYVVADGYLPDPFGGTFQLELTVQ